MLFLLFLKFFEQFLFFLDVLVYLFVEIIRNIFDGFDDRTQINSDFRMVMVSSHVNLFAGQCFLTGVQSAIRARDENEDAEVCQETRKNPFRGFFLCQSGVENSWKNETNCRSSCRSDNTQYELNVRDDYRETNCHHK